jgi:head-tail adaptor
VIVMGIGAMRHKITLQRQTRVADGGGGFAVTWSDVDDIFASIEAPSGRERFFGDKIEQNVSINVILNKNYRERYLELLCTEGAGT